MHISNERKKDIYRDLVKVSLYQAGVRGGLSEYYKNKESLKAFVKNIKFEVEQNPAKFGISEEVVKMVNDSLQERRSKRTSIVGQTEAEEPKQGFEALTVPQKIDILSHESLNVLYQRILTLKKSKAQLKLQSPAALGVLAGTMYDKRQLSRGEATEHIAIRAKIDVSKLDSKGILAAILAMREAQNNGENPI